MKFSIAALFTAGLIASVAAVPQQSSAPDSTTISIPAPTATSSYSPEVQKCLAQCPESDREHYASCQATCFGAPSPSDKQAIDTNTCVTKCDKGDGSEAATNKYASCVQTCINENYLPNPSNKPAASSGGAAPSGSATATGTGTGPKPSGSGTATSTSTGTNSQKTGAAGALTAGTSFAGVVALVAAAIAL